MSKAKRIRNTEIVLPAWAKELAEKGYMVIPNVVDAALCEKVKSRIFGWFENVCDASGKNLGFDRNRPETFFKSQSDDTEEKKDWPSSMYGIFQQYGLGQTEWAWWIRAYPTINKVFEALYSGQEIQQETKEAETEMVTSMDAVGVMAPPELRPLPSGARKQRPGFDRGNRWWHFDQGITEGLRCIQGFVAITDSDEDDGTFVCLPGSHKYHSEFMRTFGCNYTDAGDWIKPNPFELKWIMDKAGLNEVRVKAPQGSLVLWDSRLLHCNAPPVQGRAHPDRWRMVTSLFLLVLCCTSLTKGCRSFMCVNNLCRTILANDKRFVKRNARCFWRNGPRVTGLLRTRCLPSVPDSVLLRPSFDCRKKSLNFRHWVGCWLDSAMSP